MGGSSGGGGGSGAVSYPSYIGETHSDWLRGVEASALYAAGDHINTSITEVMNSALGSSPWDVATAYNPSDAIADYEAILRYYGGLLLGIDIPATWDLAVSTVHSSIGSMVPVVIDDIDADTFVPDIVVADADDITDAEIILDVNAFANQLDDEILTKVLPRFRRGMQDINAVVSSSFAIGQANIEGFRDRDVSRHSSSLRVTAALKNADVGMANMSKDVQVGIANMGKGSSVAIANMGKNVQVSELNVKQMAIWFQVYVSSIDLIIKTAIQDVAFVESYVRMSVESNRIKIVAMKEYTDSSNLINEESALWDLGVFQSGANLLAGAGGGVAAAKAGSKPSVAMSVLGGAMSGAAAGASISGGNPYGIAAGAVLGAAMGMMSSM
jgi:hypothetical protein